MGVHPTQADGGLVANVRLRGLSPCVRRTSTAGSVGLDARHARPPWAGAGPGPAWEPRQIPQPAPSPSWRIQVAARTGSGRFRSRAFGAGCDSRPVVGSRDAGRAHERHGGGRARGPLQIRGPAQAGPAGADGTVRMREGRARAWAVRPCTCAVRPVVPLVHGRRCVMTTEREPATTAPLSVAAPEPVAAPRPGAGVRIDGVSLTFRGTRTDPRARRHRPHDPSR